ncbi:ABC-ATPase domain-containing protein [Prochlorothrix hollandica]|uniref:ABC transporter ATPase n=1 Tax=Prochlorothrix hollandica PCC 9006 = CALU 1027 TaxID=317619 RepID=A0A0M2PYS7_PROHO|nr:ABC-ATPase domain-containing protein [Prochlorothrix hollandica]KKJ00233.1 ABC transporter ATPase [Prochlorothrix hollandica PCC 9006 = CALU 1027]
MGLDDRQLRQRLLAMDGSSYRTYKDLKGYYDFPRFTLIIDHVQGDPFAAPSQLRVQLATPEAGFPAPLYSTPLRAVAVEDFLVRRFHGVSQHLSQRRGMGSSGRVEITRPSQAVLQRSAAHLTPQVLEIRFTVGLPAQGRRILGRQAAELLCDDLPTIVDQSLFYSSLDPQALQDQVATVEDSHWLRQQLSDRGLIAFVPDGAILPRHSGIDDRPLPQAIPFQSPPDLRVSFQCPNRGTLRGMGIPQGVTLIVGGGYHGKSTLLRAIERGIYNHIPGDGRDYLVTNAQAVKVRAEDGRSIAGVDISPFINHLPLGQSTTQFSTTNASGSTSQAAAIMESLECGAQVLLMDEDTSATNFMIRDRRMQALIRKDQEPITPFVDKVQQLYQDHGVSTVLVMGGSGDYFDVADQVIALDNFRTQAVTAQAKAIAAQYDTDRTPEGGSQFGPITPRRLTVSYTPDDSRNKRKAKGVDTIVIDREDIDLSAVEQLIETGQLRAIGAALLYLRQNQLHGNDTLPVILDSLMQSIHHQGLDCLTPFPPSDLVEFRPFELAAALNRWRSIQLQ